MHDHAFDLGHTFHRYDNILSMPVILDRSYDNIPGMPVILDRL